MDQNTVEHSEGSNSVSSEINSTSAPQIDQNIADMGRNIITSTIVRIKDISEINSAVENSSQTPSTNSQKRRLPSWFLSPNSAAFSKVRKHIESESEDGAVSTSNNIEADSSNICLDDQRTTILGDQINNIVNGENEDMEDNKPISNRIHAEPDSNSETDANSETVANSENDANSETELNQITPSSTTSDTVEKKDVKAIVVKTEATSSIRESCKFGINCYRRNLEHKTEYAHPGDKDYRRPSYASPPNGTPDCPYGDRCYRRNPIHFRDYAHPPSTNAFKNWKNRLRKQKERKNRNVSDESLKDIDSNSDDDNYDKDPFINDDELSDYIPSDSDDSDE